MPRQLRVLLAETDELTAAILEQGLSADDLHVMRGPSSVAGLDHAVAEARANVVVIGPGFPRGNLARAVTQMLSHGARTLVLSNEALDDQSAQLLLAGASGYLLVKDTALMEVAVAARVVASGASALHPAVVELVLEHWRATRDSRPQELTQSGFSRPEVPTLSTRELEILRGLHNGCTNRMLAKQLGIAEKTVEAHKSRLYVKLGARTPPHAVRLGIELGLI